MTVIDSAILASTESGRRAQTLSVATGLLLASELMLFSGLLAAFVVLQSGNHNLFAEHARVLNAPTAFAGTLAMMIGSIVMIRGVWAADAGWQQRASLSFAGAVVLGVGYLLVTALQWDELLTRATIVAVDPASKTRYVYDGSQEARRDGAIVITGQRVVAGHVAAFDIHRISDVALRASHVDPRDGWGEFVIPATAVANATTVTYGPWKNVFYSCYYLLSGVVAVHVIAAMIAATVAWLRVGKMTLDPVAARCVARYWYFVTGVVVVSSALLHWA